MSDPRSRSGDAREEILARIRAANRSEAVFEDSVTASWQRLPRSYRRKGTCTQTEMLRRLEERLLDYDASVAHSSSEDVPVALERMLRRRGLPRTVVPEGFPEPWLPASIPLTWARDLGIRELDSFDAVLTGATVAIAETGTLVLQNVLGQGARATTLLPDYHLCVVRTDDVVATVPEAFDLLARTASLPTTFVSGPSATADIEMTRIKGVHGPRFLDVLLLD